MSETQRTLVPALRRESSDFSIERILSKNVSSSSTASISAKETLCLQGQTCPNLLNQNVAIHSSPSFVVQNKLDWLRNVCKLQTPNPRLQLKPLKPNKAVIKSTETVEQINNLDPGNFNSKELSWLRCTRYRPPKLPRKSSSGKNLKRKPGSHPRIPFTKYQLEMLEDKYKKNAYLSRKDVLHLSDLLHLPQNRIKIWFQNRRARERRESQKFQ